MNSQRFFFTIHTHKSNVKRRFYFLTQIDHAKEKEGGQEKENGKEEEKKKMP